MQRFPPGANHQQDEKGKGYKNGDAHILAFP